jgi:hypothetical protein
MDAIARERERLVSRRRLMAGSAGVLAGTIAATALPFGEAVLAQGDSPFAGDVEVLNLLLALENLETAFYRDGVGLYAFGSDGFGNDIGAWLTAIGKHEKTHVSMLSQIITGLGGTAAAEATYDFGHTDAQSFLMTAAAIENLVVSAFNSAGRYLVDLGLITAAASILAVEGRHAAYLNLITGSGPFPDALDPSQSPDDVQKAIDSYIQS